jgi:hypothetical protein
MPVRSPPPSSNLLNEKFQDRHIRPERDPGSDRSDPAGENDPERGSGCLTVYDMRPGGHPLGPHWQRNALDAPILISAFFSR